MKIQPRIYLAGPDVFYPDALARAAHKSEICRRLGLEPLVPVDNVPPPNTAPREQAQHIYRGNLALMEQADAIIANITPFRGPHMDPGTAFEIGFFVAQGKPVACYSEHIKNLAERVMDWSPGHSANAGDMRDGQGHLVENFGLQENLMIEGAVTEHYTRTAASLGHGVRAGDVLSCFHNFQAAAASLASYLRGEL